MNIVSLSQWDISMYFFFSLEYFFRDDSTSLEEVLGLCRIMEESRSPVFEWCVIFVHLRIILGTIIMLGIFYSLVLFRLLGKDRYRLVSRWI